MQALQQATDLESLFRLHEVALGRFLFGMVGDVELAEDLLQDTFAAACRWPERLDSAASAEAWLFGVARNLAVTALRRRWRLGAVLRRAASREPSPVVIPSSTRETIDLLAQLEPDDRALMLLRYWYGFQATEIADITDRSPAAVRKRLERCRAVLAVQFDRAEDRA